MTTREDDKVLVVGIRGHHMSEEHSIHGTDRFNLPLDLLSMLLMLQGSFSCAIFLKLLCPFIFSAAEQGPVTDGIEWNW